MREMTEAEITTFAESIAPKTSDETTTIIFQDGTTNSVTEECNWLGYSGLWLVIHGKADVTALNEQLLLSYNEIQYSSR